MKPLTKAQRRVLEMAADPTRCAWESNTTDEELGTVSATVVGRLHEAGLVRYGYDGPRAIRNLEPLVAPDGRTVRGNGQRLVLTTRAGDERLAR